MASPTVSSKKGKAHGHGGSHKGNHHGSASKTKPLPSRNTPQPLPPPVTKPKPDVPRSPPPQKGGHSSMFNVLDFGAKGDGETDDTKVKH